MKKNIVLLIIGLLVGGVIGGLLGILYKTIMYNPDYHVPQIIEDIAKKMPGGDEEGYPRIAMKDVSHVIGKAEILGKVTLVQGEPDGDYHVTIADGKDRMVTEIIPELKITPPKEGDWILARGLVWYDNSHHWWELHPLVSWKLVQQ